MSPLAGPARTTQNQRSHHGQTFLTCRCISVPFLGLCWTRQGYRQRSLTGTAWSESVQQTAVFWSCRRPSKSSNLLDSAADPTATLVPRPSWPTTLRLCQCRYLRLNHQRTHAGVSRVPSLVLRAMVGIGLTLHHATIRSSVVPSSFAAVSTNIGTNPPLPLWYDVFMDVSSVSGNRTLLGRYIACRSLHPSPGQSRPNDIAILLGSSSHPRIQSPW